MDTPFKVADKEFSSRLIVGRLIFLTMTEWPATAVATIFVLIPASRTACWIASVIAPELRNAPWTMASGGTGATPMLMSSTPLDLTESSTALTDEDPMSSPMMDLDFPNPNGIVVLLRPTRSGPARSRETVRRCG